MGDGGAPPLASWCLRHATVRATPSSHAPKQWLVVARAVLEVTRASWHRQMSGASVETQGLTCGLDARRGCSPLYAMLCVMRVGP